MMDRNCNVSRIGYTGSGRRITLFQPARGYYHSPLAHARPACRYLSVYIENLVLQSCEERELVYLYLTANDLIFAILCFDTPYWGRSSYQPTRS